MRLRSRRRMVPARMLIFLAIFLLLILLPIISWNLPYSTFYYSGNTNYAGYMARRRGEARVGQAETYFRKLTVKNLLPYKYPLSTLGITPHDVMNENLKKLPKNAPELSIVIMSINRDSHQIDEYEPHYLTQTTHTLLHALDVDVANNGLQWSNVSIHVCNVDKKPTDCHECNRIEELIGQKKHWHFVNDEQIKNKPKLKYSHKNCEIRHEFAYCVKQAALINPKSFVILLEDDMISPYDAFQGLRSILQSLQKRFPQHDSLTKHIGYVQLYTPSAKLHYSLQDISTWIELFFLSGGLCFLLMSIYLRIYLRPFRLLYNATFVLIVLLLCVIFVVGIGRPHWMNAYHAVSRHYRLSTITTEEFSAVLFPNETAQVISKYILEENASCEVAKIQKHEMVNEYFYKNNRQILAVYPSVFQHVGLYSSYSRSTINPHHLDA